MPLDFKNYEEGLKIQSILRSDEVAEKCGLINWHVEEKRDPKTGESLGGTFWVNGGGPDLYEIVKRKMDEKE